MNKKVVMIVVAVLVVLLVVGVVLVVFGVIKNPIANVPLLQKGPKVSVKTEYQNPFDKQTQYVNPFQEYKNPFVVAK